MANWKNLPEGADWMREMLLEVAAWEKNFDRGLPGPMGSSQHIERTPITLAPTVCGERRGSRRRGPRHWYDSTLPAEAIQKQRLDKAEKASKGYRFGRRPSGSPPTERPSWGSVEPLKIHQELATRSCPGDLATQLEEDHHGDG